MLIDPDDLDAVEPGLVVDEDSLTFGQDGGVGSVPRDRESFGDPGDGQVLDHDAFQRPPQPAARELRPRLGGTAGVVTPHVPAARAPVAAHDYLQRRRAPAQRFVRQAPDHGVTRRALATAAAAPLIGLDDTASENCATGFESLAGDLEAELVEAAELGQLRTSEGCVRQVEISWMGGIGASRSGDLGGALDDVRLISSANAMTGSQRCCACGAVAFQPVGEVPGAGEGDHVAAVDLVGDDAQALGDDALHERGGQEAVMAA